ncbi:MAG: hypothetical protein N3F03_07475 [Ignavibacteria bacterium]|nr:hypothetical protein [Ignavibacteria bacterium]
MKLKNFFTLVFLFSLIVTSHAQEIFKNSIKDYQITLSKKSTNQFNLVVTQKKKILLNKTFPTIKLYFYNLDSNPEDEMIIVTGKINADDTLNTLYVYTFERNFKLCDSIYLDKYLPEFYQFDFEGNYFVKVYDFELEKVFPSERNELPFSFYYLKDCSLVLDNEFSFEEYEAEINYLVDEIYELKRIANCEEEKNKKDLQRLFGALYINLINSSKAFDFENFVNKNYPCNDKDELMKKLKSLIEAE